MQLSNSNKITRLKYRPKGILIPADDYFRRPIYEDKYVKYIGASASASSEVDGIHEVGPYRKVLKEHCSICGGSADFKAIWELTDTTTKPRPRLKWFCAQHAKTHGPYQPFKLKVVK